MQPRLDLIGLTCRDLAASARFYRRLGVDFPDPDGPHLEATLAGGLRFALDDQALMSELGMPEPAPHGRLGIAFLCEDVDATYAELLKNGATPHKEPWDAFWGQRYAQVYDPDGVIVDLFAPLAPSA